MKKDVGIWIMPHHSISHPIIVKNTQVVKNLKGQTQKKLCLQKIVRKCKTVETSLIFHSATLLSF